MRRAKSEQLRDETIRRSQAHFPDFQPSAMFVTTTKTCLLSGELSGRPVVIKRLYRETPVWQWYFDREIERYKSFAEYPPPVKAPRLIDVSKGAADRMMVLEQVRGQALSARRYRGQSLEQSTLEKLIDSVCALNEWAEGFANVPSESCSAVDEIRQRVLPDPSAWLDWVLSGTELFSKLGALSENDASSIVEILKRESFAQFNHGDMFLRNVLSRDGELWFVDWEFAGPHVACWDLALLWLGLPAGENRVCVERAAVDDGEVFWACLAFALAREIKIKRFSFGQSRSSQVVADLEQNLRTALNHI